MRLTNLYRSLVGLAITIVSLQSAFAQTTTTETLTFDNNQLPTGWSFFVNTGSTGSNLTIQNGRFEIGETSTYGGLTKSIDTSGVSKVQIEYDANIANLYYGQGTGAALASNPLNYSAGFAQSGMGKTDRGLNTMTFQSSFQPVAGSSVIVYSNEVDPAVFGNYHISAIFENGQLSQTVTNLDTGATFASGILAAPGFLLSDMHNLILSGATTNGQPTWIDNAKITVTTPVPEPETYAMLLAGLGLVGSVVRRRKLEPK